MTGDGARPPPAVYIPDAGRSGDPDWTAFYWLLMRLNFELLKFLPKRKKRKDESEKPPGAKTWRRFLFGGFLFVC